MRVWPYVLGSLGSLMFGAAMLLFLSAMLSDTGEQDEDAAGVVGVAVLVGNMLVASSWLAVRRYGHGGVVPIVGNLALPLALIYLSATDAQHEPVRLVVTCVAVLILHSAGVAASRGLGVVRALGAFTGALWIALGVAFVLGGAVPPGLLTSALAAAGLTGLAVAVAFPVLRWRARAPGPARAA